MTGPAVFEVRRSRFLLLLQLVFAAALLVLLVVSGYELALETGDRSAIVTTIFIIVIVGFYIWQTFQQFLDRTPQIVIGPEGLTLPAALDRTIPWRRIWRLDRPRLMLGGGQVAVELDPEILVQMRFGQRFMGANVTKRRGAPNGFLILAQGLDSSADAILTAMRRHWPPADATTDDDED